MGNGLIIMDFCIEYFKFFRLTRKLNFDLEKNQLQDLREGLDLNFELDIKPRFFNFENNLPTLF